MGTYTWAEPTNSLKTEIQVQLKRLNRYSGAIDDIWGAQTVSGIQYSCSLAPMPIVIDGIPGNETAQCVDRYGRYATQWPNPNGEATLVNSQWWAFYDRLWNVLR